MKLFKKFRREIKNNLKEKWFDDCLKHFRELDKNNRFTIKEKDFLKCLDDNTSNTGFDTHYEYHQAWAARILAETKPEKHVDISSRITFNVVVSAFIPIEFYDYRPARISLDNLECKKADLLNLPFEDESIHSLSCMHTVEHIGLGRYGDKIDPDGDLKAINELKRVLKKGGNLLFVVPVGKPRIQFNGQRIYSYDMIMEYLKELQLKDYTLIPDKAKRVGIIKSATKEITDKQTYGCGCFWFQK